MTKSIRLFCAAVISCFGIATASMAETFNVFEAGTTDLLGTFDAPVAGGLVTAGSFSVDGGVFDVPAGLANFPNYDAIDSVIRGVASSFGYFANSVAYNTVDVNSNAVTCGVFECILSFTDSAGGGVPAEWYLDYVPFIGAAAAIDFGFYEIAEVAPVPLPAGGLLLLTGLGAGALLARKRRQVA